MPATVVCRCVRHPTAAAVHPEGGEPLPHLAHSRDAQRNAEQRGATPQPEGGEGGGGRAEGGNTAEGGAEQRVEGRGWVGVGSEVGLVERGVVGQG